MGTNKTEETNIVILAPTISTSGPAINVDMIIPIEPTIDCIEVIVALSFGKGAYEEVARAKLHEGLEIELMIVEELLNEK